MSRSNYRNDLIAYQINRRFPDQTKEAIAEKAPVCAQTIGRIVDGKNVSVNKLRLFTDFLGLIWEHVFNPRLTERQFHRAVLSRGSESVR